MALAINGYIIYHLTLVIFLHYLTLHFTQKLERDIDELKHWQLLGTAPSYLADDLQLTSAVGTRRQLRSADSPTLVSK